VGMATTSGVWIGGELVAEGDMTGPFSANVVLSDPTVEAAVLETARGGIVRRGLGYDWSDVAVMTNVQADHLGQDGVETIDDLLWVKSLVAERVREGGTLVLNADDERLAALADEPRVARVPKRVVYFSLHDSSVAVHRHTAAGGTALFVRDGWIVEADGGGERRVVRADAIPATLGGLAEFHVANAMGAIAACRALGVEVERIAAALEGFGGAASNAGRTNLYRVGPGHVLVDYGHNADGYRAVCRVVSRFAGRPTTGIVTLPGDRTNEAIAATARVAAAAFERIVVSEDHDLRGREPGEVARLVAEAVRDERPEVDCRIVPNEVEALDAAIRHMRSGELVVVFYEEHDPIRAVLERHGAEPVTDAAALREPSRMSA
jgi:cyanophycin synthetase